MKSDGFLFLLTLALAFGTGNITYFLKSEKIANIRDIDEINAITLNIRNERRPLIRIDLNNDYPSNEHLELLNDNIYFAPKSTSFSSYSLDCRPWVRNQVSIGKGNKFKLWMDHECDHSINVSRDFFTSPPFLLETGQSYSYLKFKQLYSRKDRVFWLIKYAKYMHIKELRSIHYELPREIDFLRKLPKDILRKILVGYTRIIDKNNFFIKTANMQYFVIDRTLAEKEYFKTGYTISAYNGEKCFFRAGNICFNKKEHGLIGYFSQASIIVFIITLFLLVLVTRKFVSRIKRQKDEEERKKHALRVLTHELRTPVASLLLLIDGLMQKTKDLPQEVNDDILRIEGDIYRLKHLAQRSQGYLQTDSKDLMNFNLTIIKSVKQFCEEIIHEYQGLDIIITTIKDCELEVDYYWLKLCLENLIENARRYGKAPIEILIDSDNNKLLLSVKDQGLMNHKNIKSLLKTKHENSQGLGLGLKILDKTLRAMNGQLKLKSEPTTFIIELPIKRKV